MRALLGLALAVAVACTPAPPPGTDPVDISLVDATAASGLPTSVGSGLLAVRDFDHDGAPDLAITTMDGRTPRLELWRNDGHGHFRRAATPQFSRIVPAACTAGDVDADGFADLVCGSPSGYGILINDGTTGFSFHEVPVAGAPSQVPLWLVVVDLAGDGRPEILAGANADVGSEPFRCAAGKARLLCRYSGASPPVHAWDRLAFVDGKWRAAVDDRFPAARTNDVQVVDWNGDGRADLFESDDFGENHLWVQDASGRFSDVLPALGAADYNHGMGVALADFDDDGSWDFTVAEVGSNELWLGGGEKLAAGEATTGLAAPTRHAFDWAPVAEDLDDDGDPDLFQVASAHTVTLDALARVATDSVVFPGAQPNIQGDDFFENRLSTDGRFFHGFVHADRRLQSLGLGRAAAADFDGDGRIDLVETDQSYDRTALRLLHNTSALAGRHWLGVLLEGHVPNRVSAGATVVVTAGGREVGRQFDAARGLGVSSGVLHFGLGEATSAHVTVVLPDGTHEFDVDTVDRVVAYDSL